MRIVMVTLWIPHVTAKTQLLADLGHMVTEQDDMEKAESLVRQRAFDLLIADLRVCFGYGASELRRTVVDGNVHALIMCPFGTQAANRRFQAIVAPSEIARIRYHGCGASRDMQRFRRRISEIEIERFRMAG